jgi:ATP-dependent Clp protease ATP-binding subunit ClpC
MVSESDLRKLRRLASERARERNETPTTVHLLAAAWLLGGPARALLEERRLDEAKLLSAARTFDETLDEAVDEVLAAARQIARHSAVPTRGSFPSTYGSGARPAAAPEPSAIHVLVILVSNRRYAAYRALSQCGVDITRLRAAARRIALGVTAPPRQPRASVARSAKAIERSSRQSDRPKRARAIQVPLIPPVRKAVIAAPPPSRPPSRPPEGVEELLPEPARSETQSSVRVAEHAAAKSEKKRASEQTFDELWLDDDQFPTLAPLENLTLAAASGQLGPHIAREPEVEQALDVLGKRHGNNALLVGPAGVGKTTVAHAIAARFLEEPEKTRRVLLELPAAELLAGTSARGSLAERVAAVRSEVRRAEGRVVLFIDEIHELLNNGAIDEVAGELKSALAAGELPMIGTTTPEEYRRCIESDPALARRFSVVEIDQPSEADCFLMLHAAAEGLADHHGVEYSDEAIAVSVSWSIRYLPGRALPAKALGVLDLAGARLARSDDTTSQVEQNHVAAVVAELAAVPVERLMQSDGERMLGLEDLLHERVVGHEEAAKRIAAVLRRNAAGLRGRRPIGTFLLLGPTGVGKTEMAKAIAAALFHSPDAMTRLDMSEYAESHAVARLVGAPPGYVGHEAGGMLTEALRKRPYQVLLLDEIEKAHRDVLQAFLQVFDEGRMTDGRGRTVDFTNAVIVLTSNLGSDALRAAATEKVVGFGHKRDPTCDTDRMQKVAMDAARSQLPPELYNRLDEMLYFRHLTKPDVRAVAKRLLDDLALRLAGRGINLDVEDAAIEALMEQGGYDAQLGARPMRRAIVRLIEAPLADMILRGELGDGVVALVSAIDGKVIVDSVSVGVGVA